MGHSRGQLLQLLRVSASHYIYQLRDNSHPQLVAPGSWCQTFPSTPYLQFEQ